MRQQLLQTDRLAHGNAVLKSAIAQLEQAKQPFLLDVVHLHEETCSMKIAATAAQPGNPFSTVVATRTSLTDYTIFVGKLLRKVRDATEIPRDVIKLATSDVLVLWAESALKDAAVVVGSFALTPLSATLQKMKVTIFFSRPQPSPHLLAVVAPQLPALVGGAYRLLTGHIWTGPRP